MKSKKIAQQNCAKPVEECASVQNNRYRLFGIISYSSREFILEVLRSHQDISRYWIIFHQGEIDIDEEGTILSEKKDHCHILLQTGNAKTCQSISKWFNDEVNNNNAYCENIKNKNAYLRYLIHLENPNKIQYSPDDVICSEQIARNEFYNALSEVRPELDLDSYTIKCILNGQMNLRQAFDFYPKLFVNHYCNIQRFLRDVTQEVNIENYQNEISNLKSKIILLEEKLNNETNRN